MASIPQKLLKAHLLPAILLPALLVALCVGGLVPAWKTLNTDFPNYFVAASLHNHGVALDRAYEWTWFQRQKDHLGIDQALVGYAPHPPLCALPLLPLTHLSALDAKRVWLLLNLLLLGATFWILQRITKQPVVEVITLGLLCIVPLRSNFVDGQYYVVILFLLTAAYFSYRSNRTFTSGLFASAAASLKLFPGALLILFLWKGRWSAAAGFFVGFVTLTAISILTFGWNVHQVYVTEVLPRALRGDLLGPYTLQWSAFSAYWHHAFLYEPELNPTPLLNSPALLAVMQSLTTVGLWLSYLLFVPRSGEETDGLEWSAALALLLLLSPMPSSYHYCVLIFVAVVGFPALDGDAAGQRKITFLLSYIAACFPWRGPFASYGPAVRLAMTLLLYVCLLAALKSNKPRRVAARPVLVAAVAYLALVALNVRAQKQRDQDFRSRLNISSDALRYANPESVGNEGYLFTAMVGSGYVAETFENGQLRRLPVPEDVLSLSASPALSTAFLESSSKDSRLYRSDFVTGKTSETPLEGQDSAMSSNGKWLAYIHQESYTSSVWLVDSQLSSQPKRLYDTLETVFEVTVEDSGDVIIAVGNVVRSRLLRVNRTSGALTDLSEIGAAIRFPAVYATRLAFSRRQGGSWHLFVRDLTSGREQQLTSASCNAVSPSWRDADTLLYATDCGRGLGFSAIVRLSLR